MKTSQSKSWEMTHNNSKSNHSERITQDSMGNRTNHRERNKTNNNNIRTWNGGLIKKQDRVTHSQSATYCMTA